MEEKKYNWDKWLCRCSAISKLLANSKDNPPLTELQEIELAELDKKPNRTEKQGIRLTELIQKREKSKDVKLGDVAVQYLLESYAWETERMVTITKELDVEAFERGRKTEPESIELVSFVDNVAYLKNETRFQNDFLTGIPDILSITVAADNTYVANKIRELKSTRDYPTFLYKIHKGLDPGNREQVAGYGDILQCEDLAVNFTLPSMPIEQREGYKYKLASRMGEATTESPRFLKSWAEIEHSMVFNSIPHTKRVYKIPVAPFIERERQQVYDKVKYGREWLQNFHTQYLKLNT